MTTTDGEQPDDSLDLIDGLPEMSPPPVTIDEATATNCSGGPSNGPCRPDSNISAPRAAFSNGAQSQRTNGSTGTNGNSVPPTIQVATSPTSTSSTAGMKTGVLNCETLNINGAPPPPTPLIGACQESRFSFASGRTPPLPDLRATEFFRYAKLSKSS